MPAPPLEEMRIVASRLKPLNVPFAFVGGAVMCLLVDHPELTDFRRTKDVDVVVAAITYFEFAALEAPRSPKPRHRPCTCVSRGPKIAWSTPSTRFRRSGAPALGAYLAARACVP